MLQEITVIENRILVSLFGTLGKQGIGNIGKLQDVLN